MGGRGGEQVAQRTEPLGREPIKTAAHKPGKESVLNSVGFWTPIPPTPIKNMFLIRERDIYALQSPRDCLRDSHLETGTVELLHCGCIAVDGRGDTEVDKRIQTDTCTQADKHPETDTEVRQTGLRGE